MVAGRIAGETQLVTTDAAAPARIVLRSNCIFDPEKDLVKEAQRHKGDSASIGFRQNEVKAASITLCAFFTNQR
jgi:hypothetical protein